ncbi:MAG TPA: alpha-amylase family glycosyl hydrolase, partial [Protaetiibacter sp.]|nr:alpha-amylase family glycosyl hydrolase [Protaetiibacter sp.]
MKITDTSDLWWKTAVVYCLDVETYMDWDGDGRGDIEGLTHRIDHLADLGVTCLWLMPFYPTPGRDDGYDVADFLDVDARLGDLGRFVELLRTAKDRGMRVIVDLVVNHTSDRHPWFRTARSNRDSVYHDYYVWRDEKPKQRRESVFPGEESGVWSYDDKAERYYLHN